MAIVKSIPMSSAIRLTSVAENTKRRHIRFYIFPPNGKTIDYKLKNIDNPDDLFEIEAFVKMYKKYKACQVYTSWDGNNHKYQDYKEDFDTFESKLSDENKLLLEIIDV